MNGLIGKSAEEALAGYRRFDRGMEKSFLNPHGFLCNLVKHLAGLLYPLMNKNKLNEEEWMMSNLNLEVAKKLIEGAEQEAQKIGVNMVISVLDEGGNLIAIHRMDDAWLASVEIAQNKAWTSVALKMPTSNLEAATVPNAELYGLNTTNNGRIVVFGGGIPLTHDGKVVGAVGVSGSSVEHDVQVAEAAVNVFENLNISAGR